MIERICTILLFNLIFYFKALKYNYSSDDIPAARRQKHPIKWKFVLGVLEGRARSTPQIDHALTTLFHALTCVFIYLGFGANNISFLASFLFAFNPVTNQGSVWISGRSYVYPTLGILASIAIPILSPLLMLGVTYYNAGFISPLLVLGSSSPWIAAFVPLGWAVNGLRFRRNVLAKVKMEMFAEDRKLHPRKIVIATKTFGFYLLHSLIPVRTTFYHAFLQSAAGCMKDRAKTMKDHFFFVGLASIAGIALYLTTHPWGITSFGLVWWCVGILPFLNIVRIHQEIAERYCYLPTAGLMVALASVLVNHPAIYAGVLAMYATKMWFYMDAYQDDFWLVEHACINSQNAWFAWHVKAMRRWEIGSHKEAIIYWTMARMISPKEFKLNFNLATAMKLGKQMTDAETLIKTATENIPEGQEAQCKVLLDKWHTNEMSILL